MKHKILIPVAIVAVLIVSIALFVVLRPPTKLQGPELERPLGFVELPDDRLLVTDGGGFDWNDSGSEVMIIDRKGRVHWSYSQGLRFAHSAIVLQNGNILIPDTNNDRLVEVSLSKKVVWESAAWGNGTGKLEDGSHLNYPNYVQELENGHFLVSDRLNSRVIEVDRQGRIYWRFTGAAKQHAPKEIGDGRYLIADSDGNRVIEVDREGKIIWQFNQGLAWPRDGVRLANGNTLITDSRNGRVIEVTREGQVAREIKGPLAVPYQAKPVNGGNILICDSQHARLVEVDERGKIIWQFRNLRRRNLSRAVLNGDIESLDEKGYPVGWTVCNLSSHNSGRWLIDHTHRISGDNSLSLQASGSLAMPKSWAQRIKVKPGSQLLVSAFIRTLDVKGGATFSIAFQDPLGGPTGGVNIPIINGTNDWKRHSIVVDIPKKVNQINLSLTLLGVGQVWFDDISLGTYQN